MSLQFQTVLTLVTAHFLVAAANAENNLRSESLCRWVNSAKGDLWVTKRAVQELADSNNFDQLLRCMPTNVLESDLNRTDVVKALSRSLRLQELPRLRLALGIGATSLVMARAGVSDQDSLEMMRAKMKESGEEAENIYALVGLYALADDAAAHSRIVQILTVHTNASADILREALLISNSKISPKIRAVLEEDINRFYIGVKSGDERTSWLATPAVVSSLILGKPGGKRSEIALIERTEALLRPKAEWCQIDWMLLLAIWRATDNQGSLMKAVKAVGNVDCDGHTKAAILALISGVLDAEKTRLAVEQFVVAKDKELQLGALELLRCLGYEARGSSERILTLLEGGRFQSDAIVEAIHTLSIIGDQKIIGRLAAFQNQSKDQNTIDAVTSSIKALKLEQ